MVRAILLIFGPKQLQIFTFSANEIEFYATQKRNLGLLQINILSKAARVSEPSFVFNLSSHSNLNYK